MQCVSVLRNDDEFVVGAFYRAAVLNTGHVTPFRRSTSKRRFILLFISIVKRDIKSVMQYYVSNETVVRLIILLQQHILVCFIPLTQHQFDKRVLIRSRATRRAFYPFIVAEMSAKEVLV